MLDMNLLKNVRYVVDGQGKKAAIQLDLQAWVALLDYLEELEDRTLIKEKLGQLSKGPEKPGAVTWDEAKPEW
jgi:hypothetical protein